MKPLRFRPVVWGMLLLGALPAQGASRARYGGRLRTALATPIELPPDPLKVDSTEGASVLRAFSPPLCTSPSPGQLEAVLGTPTRAGERKVSVVLKSALAPGHALGSRELIDSWSRVLDPQSPSPYRALLAPARLASGALAAQAASPTTVELTLAFPWPDLETSLCHPALTPVDRDGRPFAGTGPFLATAQKGVLRANPSFVNGRPYLDQWVLSPTNERGAERQRVLNQAQLSIGGADASGANPTGATAALSTAPMQQATYLLFRPERVGPSFRTDFARAVDRAQLARYFVRGPKLPLQRLIPGDDSAAPLPAVPGAFPSPSSPSPVDAGTPATGAGFTLFYDEALEDQRRVAERLQLKLAEHHYRISLQPLPLRVLRQRWNAGDYDLMLQALLLPPEAAPALAVVIEASGRHELLAQRLPELGAIADPAARAERAQRAADLLLPQLPLIPLYRQGLRSNASPGLKGLTFDAQGLISFDQLFLDEG